jgi:hypothetical protein
VVALLVVRVENATPIILNCEKSVTLGTLGTLALVAVHEALTRNGRAVCRCGIDENPGVRLLEIPHWMFDSVDCCRMRMAKVPTVSCGALLDLKALLLCASFPDSAVHVARLLTLAGLVWPVCEFGHVAGVSWGACLQ